MDISYSSAISSQPVSSSYAIDTAGQSLSLRTLIFTNLRVEKKDIVSSVKVYTQDAEFDLDNFE